MGKLSAQNQLYIAIALIAVVTIAVVFLGILPLFQDAAEVDGQIATEQQSLAAAQALLARRQSAKAQSAANEVELMRIANQIPDSPQLPSVIIEVQELANISGVVLMQITPGDLVPAVDESGADLGYGVVDVAVVISDVHWANHIDFLRRLPLLDRGVRIVSVVCASIEGDDDEPAYIESTIVIQVYVMASPEAATMAAPAPSTTPTETP